MKKFLITLSIMFLFMITLHNNEPFTAQYSVILENPPYGYSPSGDPVIVAQGILRSDESHTLSDFVDCPDPSFVIVWDINGRVSKYQLAPEILESCDVIARPLSFTLYGKGSM